MAIIYRTSQDDVLDLICVKHYGHESAVPQVLAANPNLAEYGSMLPSGVEITLPEIAAKKEGTVSLWD